MIASDGTADDGMEVVRLTLLIADPYDGAIRLLCDAQRLGLALLGLDMHVGTGGNSQISLSVAFSKGSDPVSIASRLARHPTVSSIAMAPVQGNSVQ